MPIRVLIVDDSAFMRNALGKMLASDPDIEVAGIARDGVEALEKIVLLKPDLVTMDIEMPRMDGIEALRRIMATSPLPVIMVSSLTTEGARATLEALEIGAVDFLSKNLADLSLNILQVREALLEKVKQIGRERNTLVMFLSDNGAGAEEILSDWQGIHIPKKTTKGLAVSVGNDPQTMPGGEETYQSYGVPWANVSNTPFRLYKSYCHEGGIAVPLIVRWPEVIQPSLATGDLTREIGHAIDIMATCCDVAGVAYPSIHAGYRIKPLEGVSLLPAFLGKEMPMRPVFFEHEGNRAVRYGRWKLVAVAGGRWELYDMNADRTENFNLAEKEPDVVGKMASLYDQWAARVGVEPWQ